MKSELFSRVQLLIFFILTLSLALASASALPNQFGRLDIEHLWVIHLTLELLSIFVSVSIVAILFQRMDQGTSRFTNTVIFSFTSVALIDFIHSLSYQGMPMLVTESSTGKAIFFWLSSRTLELIAMAAIAFELHLRGRKVVWLLAAAFLATIIGYAGLYHLDSFPVTFIPESGVTPFKTNFEYALFIGNSGLAFIFLRKYLISDRGQHLYFAGSCYAMALCALTLANYAAPSDSGRDHTLLTVGNFFLSA